MSAAVADALSGIISGEGILRGPERREWAVAGAVPEAVVFPRTVEETAGVLRLASREGWRVVPAGRGRWLGGGPPPDRVDVVLSTRRMDRILQYEAADLTISLEAGAGLDGLAPRLEERGQWLPLDPPGASAGTVGALLATGTAGPLEAGFGRPRDHVLGLVLVTGDGRVLRLGGRVVKNVAGYDLVRLAVGSRGTLGVVTEATLRLFPRPERDATLRVRCPGWSALVEAARRVATAPVSLSAVEVVGSPGTAPALLVRMLGGADAVESTLARVAERLDGVGGVEADRLEDAASAALHRELEAIEDGASVVARLALLPARLGETLARAEELADRARTASGGAAPTVTAHVTTGVVRVVLRSGPGPEEFDAWADLLRGVRVEIEGSGGSLTLSSGPPELLRAVGTRGAAGRVATLLEGLKDAFDPAGVLAPGRLPGRGDPPTARDAGAVARDS